MISFRHRRPDPLVAAQVGFVAGGLALLALAPPAAGRMLLVPLGTAALHRLVPVAVANGALMVAPGPWGSMVVVGERTRLLRPLMARGIVVLAAPAAGCGRAGARS